MASTLSDQHFLSPATAVATSQLFHPALFSSFSTVLLQVVFGLPLALRPSGVHPNAVKQPSAFTTLETKRKLGRLDVCKDFWDC